MQFLCSDARDSLRARHFEAVPQTRVTTDFVDCVQKINFRCYLIILSSTLVFWEKLPKGKVVSVC